MKVAGAIDSIRLLLCAGQYRYQHRRQNRDDGNDDKKLNQGKSRPRLAGRPGCKSQVVNWRKRSHYVHNSKTNYCGANGYQKIL
jgi:hypothetical protein